MRQLSLLTLFAVFALTACGSTPESQCRASLEVFCDKMHECTDAADKTDDWKAFWGSDTSSCTTMWNDGFQADFGGVMTTIDGAKCEDVTAENACEGDEAGTVYHAAEADACIDGSRSMTCAEYLDENNEGPAACGRVCQAS